MYFHYAEGENETPNQKINETNLGTPFLSLYILLYIISKKLRGCALSLMANRSKYFGGIQIHMLFQIPVEGGTDLYRLTEIAIAALIKKTESVQILRTMNVILIDERSGFV